MDLYFHTIKSILNNTLVATPLVGLAISILLSLFYTKNGDENYEW